jgi:hypothetical protein
MTIDYYLKLLKNKIVHLINKYYIKNKKIK